MTLPDLSWRPPHGLYSRVTPSPSASRATLKQILIMVVVRRGAAARPGAGATASARAVVALSAAAVALYLLLGLLGGGATTEASASSSPMGAAQAQARAEGGWGPKTWALLADSQGPGGAAAEPRAETDALETATFAAGCFWGVQLRFQRIGGVVATEVGYAGGALRGPTYRDVVTGATGHAEAVAVRFDPRVVSFASLIDVFFELHDPTTLNRQGNDVGSQYRSAIFAHSAEQLRAAKAGAAKAQRAAGVPVVTEVAGPPPPTFWPAEEYHQEYLWKGGQSKAKGSTVPIRCYG